ncbi:MAG TPA: aldehyde dehydrogenase family protein [Elusimicrobiota bacterium]|nr:aldehyde dehydrogenase family protein [Elusimicrobiota bacterium]
MTEHRLFIDGGWEDGASSREILSPFSGKAVARCAQASPEQLERALAAAERDGKAFRKISRYARSRLLAAMARGIERRRAELSACIVSEAGKPVTLADGEAGRATSTFTLAAEEAKRLGGEVVPVDLDSAGRAFAPAVSHWAPRGPVLAIAPFNFPLNLVAHKVAPALAVGASVIVKPPPQAPGAARILAEIFQEAAGEASDARETIPPAALQVLSGSNDVVGRAVLDPRIAILSFTGSDKAGWLLQGQAVRKKVLLELGGNAAVIVEADADLARAAARCAYGAFAYAGQVCISVQRILVRKEAAARFTELLLAETAKIQCGDPARPEVLAGPLIDAAAADRVAAWIEESRRDGAKVLCGGARAGNVIAPAVVAGVKPSAKLSCEEVFGPVATVGEYASLDEAIAAVNASRFGLQAGLFAGSAASIRRAADELEVGGLLVNEVPTYRADNLPYGGLKDSGLGREGVRYAMEEYCERRTVVEWRGEGRP